MSKLYVWIIVLSTMITAPLYPDTNITLSEFYRIESITVQSNKRTREKVILNEITILEGTNYSRSILTEILSSSVQELKNTGIFRSVEIDIEPIQTLTNEDRVIHEVNATVTVIDRWTLFPVPLLYYDNKDGLVFTMNLMEFNFFGLNHQLSINAILSGVQKTVGAKYKFTHLFQTDLDMEFEGAYSQCKEYQYEETELVYESDQLWIYGFLNFNRNWKIKDTEIGILLETRIEYRSNDVFLNSINKSVRDGTRWTIGVGLSQGVINRDQAVIWGDHNEFRIRYAPLDRDFELELLHSKYFKVGAKNVFAYRINAFYQPVIEKQLSSKTDIRGVKLGAVRGNYGFFGNVEFRAFLVGIGRKLAVDFYVPFFVDFANAASIDEPFVWHDTVITAGSGLHLYAPGIGGADFGLLIDLGINLRSLTLGREFKDYFFVKAGVQKLF